MTACLLDACDQPAGCLNYPDFCSRAHAGRHRRGRPLRTCNLDGCDRPTGPRQTYYCSPAHAKKARRIREYGVEKQRRAANVAAGLTTEGKPRKERVGRRPASLDFGDIDAIAVGYACDGHRTPLNRAETHLAVLELTRRGGLTQQQIADRLGVTTRYVQRALARLTDLGLRTAA